MTQRSELKVVCFDMGGVLLSAKDGDVYCKLAEALGIDPTAFSS